MGHLVTILNRKSKNLLPSFRSWTLHANAVVTEPYKLTLVATATFQQTSIDIPAVAGSTYTLSVPSTISGRIAASWRAADGSSISTLAPIIGADISSTSTAPPNAVRINIVCDNFTATSGTFVFTNPQLELGSAATPFEPK